MRTDKVQKDTAEVVKKVIKIISQVEGYRLFQTPTVSISDALEWLEAERDTEKTRIATLQLRDIFLKIFGETRGNKALQGEPVTPTFEEANQLMRSLQIWAAGRG